MEDSVIFDSSNGWGERYGISLFKYDKLLDLFIGLFSLVASFFTPGGPTGAGWTLYPPQAILGGTPGQESGIILMLISLSIFIVGFTMGGLNYIVTILQARTRGMTLMRMPLAVWGIFTAGVGYVCIPSSSCECNNDDFRQDTYDKFLYARISRDG